MMGAVSIPVKHVDGMMSGSERLSLIAFPCTDSGAPTWIKKHHQHPVVDLFTAAVEKAVRKHGMILRGESNAMAVFWGLPSALSELVVRMMLPHPRGFTFDLCGIVPPPREVPSPFSMDGMGRCGFSLRISGLNSCEFDAVAGIVEIEPFMRHLRSVGYPTGALEHLEEITLVSPDRNQRAARSK
jgi:hypothetical protein